MIELLCLDGSDRCNSLHYEFVTQSNPNWKQSYYLNCLITKTEPLYQGSKSDYEFFLATESKKRFNNPKTIYLLLVNGIPVTSMCVIMRNPNIADISCVTSPRYQRKGYAKLATQMLEERLFQNPNLVFTTIMDMTKNKIASRIAIQLGYVFNPDTDYFIKFNPNLNMDQMKRELKV